MSRKLLILSVLLLVFLLGVIVGVNLYELAVINMKGTVHVPEQVTPTMGYKIIVDKDIEIYINTSHGTTEIKLGEIAIPSHGLIIISRDLLEAQGDFKLLLNGKLDLVSSELSYEISMPCLVNIKERCYRIEAIIPGYDEPMEILPGTYNTRLTLEWVASGVGTFTLRLIMYYTESSDL